MVNLKRSIALAVVMTLAAAPAWAGWRDLLRSITGGESSQSSSTSASQTSGGGLTRDEVVAGLKQALSNGVKHAVDQLGKRNGFLDNARVRIPMPKHMRTAEKLLRDLGQGRYADEFVATMNHAAEQAVVQAAPVFRAALQKMTVDDAMKILRGPPDAATRYFREKTTPELTERMLPIVRQATDKAGVTAAYKRVVDRLGFARGMLGDNMSNIDRYITDKTLQGLFLLVADQERQIREHPVARTTELLKKVFGAAMQR